MDYIKMTEILMEFRRRGVEWALTRPVTEEILSLPSHPALEKMDNAQLNSLWLDEEVLVGGTCYRVARTHDLW